MSGKGEGWDKAPIERFLGSLKSEGIPEEGYDSEYEARINITRYNTIRSHSYNQYPSPVAAGKLAA